MTPVIEDRQRHLSRRTAPLRSSTVPWVEILAMAIAALWANKLRTALTMLGIIIGITAVIGVTAIGQGVQQSTAERLQGLGADVVQIFAGSSNQGPVNQGVGSATTLTWDDARTIEAQVWAVDAVSAQLQQNAQVVHGQNNLATTILGTDSPYPIVNHLSLQSGRWFTDSEVTTGQAVAVLGPTVRDDLFGEGGDPIGASIRIQGDRYSVIGVAQAKGSQGRSNPDEQVYVPLLTLSTRMVGNNALAGVAVQSIAVSVNDAAQLDGVMFHIKNLLRVRHGLYPSRGDDDDFRLRNAAEIVSTLSSTMNLFTLMVVAIASISLLVGGIGIANIMLVSVVERTREIGIRKALGATSSAILQQFLVEAVAIALVGGVAGIALGVASARLASLGFGFPFVLSGWAIALGFGLSFLIGLTAGVIPARHAAQLDPITALRSD